jgi:hypothetical protein
LKLAAHPDPGGLEAKPEQAAVERLRSGSKSNREQAGRQAAGRQAGRNQIR